MLTKGLVIQQGETALMILITGAAGKTGRAVIQRLAANGQRVRGLVRRQEQAILLEQLGVWDTIAGDMRSQTTMDRAVLGARAIYHICPNMHPEETLIGEIVIRAAQSAGIERFVYHSVLHPQIEAMAHHWQKMRVEEYTDPQKLDHKLRWIRL